MDWGTKNNNRGSWDAPWPTFGWKKINLIVFKGKSRTLLKRSAMTRIRARSLAASLLLLIFTWRHQNSNYKTIDPTGFYFHGVLEQLKTNFYTNFCFKRVLGFVIEYAWISKLLRDAAFTWRPRELSFRLKKVTFFEEFCYLNSSSIRKSFTLMFTSSSRSKFTLF